MDDGSRMTNAFHVSTSPRLRVPTVQRGLAAFIAETDADEIMVTAQMFDHAARLRSFEIVAEVRDALAATTAETTSAA